MPVLHEPANLADLLKYEAPNLYSRDEVVVAASQTLALGAVVGRVTATREIVALDPAATGESPATEPGTPTERPTGNGKPFLTRVK